MRMSAQINHVEKRKATIEINYRDPNEINLSCHVILFIMFVTIIIIILKEQGKNVLLPSHGFESQKRSNKIIKHKCNVHFS